MDYFTVTYKSEHLLNLENRRRDVISLN